MVADRLVDDGHNGWTMDDSKILWPLGLEKANLGYHHQVQAPSILGRKRKGG
jgi:hypothetical protein